jgi:polyisoprenoid-binding protein YceI
MEMPATFELGAGNARVSFSVRWFGVLQVRGSFDDVSGMVAVPGRASPGARADDASVSIQVKSQSVRTGISLRDRHLRGLRFLDSERHPVIRFVSDEVSRHNGVWDVRGKLTLRGQERSVSASVPDEPDAAGRRRLRAEFSVPRRPHAIGTARGIRRLNPLLWAIGDDVTLHVELLVPATLFQPAAAHVPGH